MGSYNLWRHPEDGALHGHGGVVAVDVVRLFRDAKIRDLASAVGVEQDVVGLEVAMQYAFVV